MTNSGAALPIQSPRKKFSFGNIERARTLMANTETADFP
jgi:hypothetical protein